MGDLRKAVANVANEIDIRGVSHTRFVAMLEAAAAEIQDEVTRIVFEFRQNAAILAYLVIDASVTPTFDDDTDAERASAVGHSYAAAWLAAILMFGYSAKRARVSQDYRLKRIAATEVFQAYNAAAVAAFKELTPKLNKIWVCNDPCPECAAHDGEIVPVTKQFSNGDVPGDMHPRCRCLAELTNAVS